MEARKYDVPEMERMMTDPDYAATSDVDRYPSVLQSDYRYPNAQDQCTFRGRLQLASVSH